MMAAPDPLFSPGYFANPYPTLAALRAQGPVFQKPQLGYMLFQHADVRGLARCPHLSKALLEQARIEGLPEEAQRLAKPVLERAKFSMLQTDPPTHTRLRSQATKAFTTRAAEAMRPRIEALEDLLLDAMAETGGMDVVRDFAFPLPAAVIMELLGVPAADRDRLKQWTADAVTFLGALRTSADPVAVARKGAEGNEALRAYAADLIEKKRGNPQPDFISQLVQVQQAEDGRMNVDEVISQSVLLLAAGHETTTNLIANGLLAFLRHPEQWRALCADPSLARGAVDEVLRYDPPVQLTARVTTEPMEIGGVAIPAGSRIVTMLGAANRDPEHFPEPERFDIRRGAADHVSFGFDRHLCLGAHLARIEGEIAFRRFAERFPDLRLADGAALEYQPNPTFRALKALPVTF